MAELNYTARNQTLLEIDRIEEAEQKKEEPRLYLGASEIGDECVRKLFYNFRGVSARFIQASGLKAINDGFRQEDIMASRLRKLPSIELHTVDPENPKRQIGFEFLNGHMRGNCDGIIRGIVEAPRTWHVWENKAVNDEKFDKLNKLIDAKGEKSALIEWDYTYYAQAMIYMAGAGLERHYLTVESPGGRRDTSCRTEFHRKDFELFVEKGRGIIFDNWNTPARMNDNPEYFKCKWCQHQKVCHFGDFPDINCRGCRYRDPQPEGVNYCLFHDKPIDKAIIHHGCSDHVYNPAIMPHEVKFVEHQADACIYRFGDISFANASKNGFPECGSAVDFVFSSFELKEKIKNVSNLKAETAKIVKSFDGEVVQDEMKAWKKTKKLEDI